MGHHRHLTLEQREMVMAFHAQGKTITEIAEDVYSRIYFSIVTNRNSAKFPIEKGTVATSMSHERNS